MSVDMPDVFDAIPLQELMHLLTDLDQSVFVSAGDPQ